MTNDIRITFEDKEFRKIKKIKEINEVGWKEFIYYLIVRSERENIGRRKIREYLKWKGIGVN